MHDLDEVAIDRALTGERTRLSKAERREAVRRGAERGLTYNQIADRLHIGERMVHRDLQALGVVGAHD